MKIEQFTHKNVLPNGTFSDHAGAVQVNGSIRTSNLNNPEGGCNQRNCNCSPGHWVAIVLPRNNKNEVNGVTIYFKNQNELKQFIIILNNFSVFVSDN